MPAAQCARPTQHTQAAHLDQTRPVIALARAVAAAAHMLVAKVAWQVGAWADAHASFQAAASVQAGEPGAGSGAECLGSASQYALRGTGTPPAGHVMDGPLLHLIRYGTCHWSHPQWGGYMYMVL